jgi:hypothetical protein
MFIMCILIRAPSFFPFKPHANWWKHVLAFSCGIKGGHKSLASKFWKDHPILEKNDYMSTFTVFVMKDKIILYFMTLTKSFLQGSPKAQTYLVIGEVPYKLLVLHVSNPSSIIPPWNTKIHNYVMFIFGFVNKYLASTSNVLLFHDDNH